MPDTNSRTGMTRALSKFGDVVGAIVMFGCLLGVLFGVWQYAADYLPFVVIRTDVAPLQTTGGILGLLALIALLEALFPLRGMSGPRWVYYLRPQGRLRGMDSISVLQLLGVTALVLLLCVSLGTSPLFALAAPALRMAVGWRSFTVASLLAAGRSRQVSSSGVNLLDSEVSSDALASQSMWLKPRIGSSASLAGLFARRLSRRWYIGVGALAVAGLSLGFAPHLGSLGILAFAAAWSMVGAAVSRAGSFGRIVEGPWAEWGLPMSAAIGTAIIGTVFVAIVWQLSLAALAVIAVGLAWAGYTRSRPARVTQMSMVDTGGFGASFSPEVVGYLSRGWKGLAVVAVALFL